MTTLYDALYYTAGYAGVAKGGRTTIVSPLKTNIVDTNRYENEDYYNNGTLFLDGVTYRVTDYVQTTGIITFTPASADYTAASTSYQITNASREELLRAVNQALLQMGRYTLVNEDLVVVDNQRDYSLPSGVSDVVRVEVADEANGYSSHTINYSWREIGGKLYFPDKLSHDAGRTIRVYYNGSHSSVDDDDDVINDKFNLTRLGWTAAHLYLLWRMQYSGNEDEREAYLIKNAEAQAEKYARMYPVTGVNKTPVLSRW